MVECAKAVSAATLTRFSNGKHHNDPDIGVAVIDSYTHHVLQYLEGIKIGSNATMQEFVRTLSGDANTTHNS